MMPARPGIDEPRRSEAAGKTLVANGRLAYTQVLDWRARDLEGWFSTTIVELIHCERPDARYADST